MKEATGEMTMTIVVILAIVAVLTLAKPIWNIISERIKGEVNNVGNTAYVEVIEDYNV